MVEYDFPYYTYVSLYMGNYSINTFEFYYHEYHEVRGLICQLRQQYQVKTKSMGFKKVILTRIAPNSIVPKYIDNVPTFLAYTHHCTRIEYTFTIHFIDVIKLQIDQNESLISLYNFILGLNDATQTIILFSQLISLVFSCNRCTYILYAYKYT